MKLLSFFPLLLFTCILSGQDLLTIHNGCNFNGNATAAAEEEFYIFDPSNEADKIVKQILDGAGALSYTQGIKRREC